MPDFMDEAKNLAGEHADVVDKGLDVRDGLDAPMLGEEERRISASTSGGIIGAPPAAQVPDLPEVTEVAAVRDAPRGARCPDDRLDRDQRGAREDVHGSVPVWRDAQSLLVGHTERNVERAAAPQRHALRQRLQGPRMLRDDPGGAL